MKKALISIPIIALLLAPPTAFAHCPLCTAGAGLAAITAKWLGVALPSIGIFIGAFGIALGLWFVRLIKFQIPYKSTLFALGSYLLTVIPLLPLMPEHWSFYLTIGGDYGSLGNRTYIINSFLAGSIIGAGIMLISPTISAQIAKARGNKLFPFQGIVITFSLLISLSLIIEILQKML